MRIPLCDIIDNDGRQCQRPVHPDSPIALCWTHLFKAARFAIDVAAPDGGLDHAFLNLICPDCKTESVTAVRAYPEAWCTICRREVDREQCERTTAAYRTGLLTAAERLLREHRVPAGQPLVYFIRFSDRVKIGTTTDLARRLNELPHDEVLAVAPGDVRAERALHRRFRHLHVTGEWFTDCTEIRTFAAQLRRNAGVRA